MCTHVVAVELIHTLTLTTNKRTRKEHNIRFMYYVYVNIHMVHVHKHRRQRITNPRIVLRIAHSNKYRYDFGFQDANVTYKGLLIHIV